MKKLIAGGAAAVVITALLTGCSGGSASSEKVELSFQSLAFQEATVQKTAKIIEEWNAAHPNVHVNILQSNYDDVHDQLVTQFQSNTAPDLIYDEASDITGFAQQGYLADLSPVLTDDLKSSISDDMWGIVTTGDKKIVAVPALVQSYVAFVNTDALAAAGVPMPTGDSLSWEELRGIAKKLTKDGKYGIGWGLKQPAAAMMNTALGYGGTFFDVKEDGSATIDVGKGELAVPEQVHAMLQDDKSMDPTAATQSTSDVIPGFFAGKYGIYIGANYLAQQLTEAAPKDFKLSVMPPLAGDKGTAQAANPQTLSIAAQSQHQKEAGQFLDFFMNAENQAGLAEADWLRPVSSKALEVLEKQTADKPIWKPLLKAGNGVASAPFTKTLNYPQWKLQYATPGLQRYFAGTISKDDLAKLWSDGWKTISG